MSQRVERVASEVRGVLGEVLARDEIKDPRVRGAGLITVTHVRVSGDLQHARLLHRARPRRRRARAGAHGAQPRERLLPPSNLAPAADEGRARRHLRGRPGVRTGRARRAASPGNRPGSGQARGGCASRTPTSKIRRPKSRTSASRTTRSSAGLRRCPDRRQAGRSDLVRGGAPGPPRGRRPARRPRRDARPAGLRRVADLPRRGDQAGALPARRRQGVRRDHPPRRRDRHRRRRRRRNRHLRARSPGGGDGGRRQ